MVAFRHALIPKVELTRTTTEIGRVYHTPHGRFPSVTTVLKYALDQSGLDAWRESVGEDEAEYRSKRASVRGTAVHAIAERYLKNDPDWDKDAMPFNLATFMSLKTLLDRNVDEIWGIEYPLWSPVLGTAGTVDLLCEWRGEPAIVDFKTAAKSKSEDSDVMRKYLLQVAIYGIMAIERTGINIRKLVILSCPDDEMSGRAVTRNLEDYAPFVKTLFSNKNRQRWEMPKELLPLTSS